MRSLCAVAALLLCSCSYDPPPAVDLVLPSSGLYTLGDPLLIDFSEPVEPGSVVVRIWPAGDGDRTIENDYAEGLEPALADCSPQLHTDEPAANCGESVFVLSEDRLQGQLVLNDAVFAKARVPWELEILAGIADGAGRRTGVSHRFPFQFAPAAPTVTDPPDGESPPEEVVPFKDGVYLLHAPIEDPVKTQLTMYVDLLALDDGTISMTAGKAAAIDGAAKNTKDLSELVVDTTDGGFCIHTGGVITMDGDGERFLATDALDVNLNLIGILLTLTDVKITGAVQAHGDRDTIEGTINYSSIAGLGDFVFEAGNSAFTMTWIPAEEVPSGAPRNCGSLVGDVKNECNPPTDFPPAVFCADDEATAE